MPSQSISPLYCLCGWQMTELDLSVIRWGGKNSFPLSPSSSSTHTLFLCVLSCTFSLWCFAFCEVFFLHLFLSCYFSSKHFPHFLFPAWHHTIHFTYPKWIAFMFYSSESWHFFSSMLENLFDVEPQHVCKSGTTFIKPYVTKRLLVCGYSEHKYLSLCR